MIRLLTGAALAVLLLLGGPALADAAAGKLLSRLRSLTQQYDGIAGGTSAPHTGQIRELREQFRAYLTEAATSAPDSQPLRELAEIFVFSGGDSAALQPFGKGLEPGSIESKLYEGVMAYGDGRTSEAEAKLPAIDAAKLSPMRAGHLCLALALLLGRDDPNRAFGYFQDAALFLPGTLVEEAALRQTAVLAAKISDPEKFTAATIAYLLRFRRSAYIDGFEMEVALYIAQFPEQPGMRIFRAILNAFPDGWGRCLDCFLISIAGQAIQLGKLDLAYAAATAGLPLVAADSRARQRLLLYAGAAAIVTGNIAQGVDNLHAVQESMLDPEDSQLLQASLALGLKLREIPAALNTGNQDGLEVAPAGDRVFPVSGPLEAAARHAISDADSILKSAK